MKNRFSNLSLTEQAGRNQNSYKFAVCRSPRPRTHGQRRALRRLSYEGRRAG